MSRRAHLKPRVLQVIDHTGSGGAQVALLQLIEALKQDYSFAIAVLGESGKYSSQYRALGIPVHALGQARGRWNPLPIKVLTKMLCRERIDLVHTHLFKSCLLGTVSARLAGSRVIVHDHSDALPDSLSARAYFSNPLLVKGYVRLYRHALKMCDRAIVLTNTTQRAYVDLYSVPGHKVNVLPHGINFRRFSKNRQDRRGWLRAELGLPDNTKLVLMVGRLEPVKDWDTFLNVAERVRHGFHQPCAFLVVGAGSQRTALERKACNHELRSVYMLGHRNDVPELLNQADLFVLTSRTESFGIVVLEAMAAGCPVVATRSGGPDAILTHEADGLLSDVGDVKGLADHVLRLLHDTELRDNLVQTAQTTVSRDYSLEAMSRGMANIYREVLRQ